MNIIEFAKFKTMFGGGGASVYTAKERKELPIDAVDGSLAIVESESVVGKWKFNETINVGENKINTGCVCCAKDDRGIKHVGNTILMVRSGGETYVQIITQVDDVSETVTTIYTDTAGWTGFQTREVEMFTDITDSEKELLKANATRISGGQSLYAKENGKWVYKCEIA